MMMMMMMMMIMQLLLLVLIMMISTAVASTTTTMIRRRRRRMMMMIALKRRELSPTLWLKWLGRSRVQTTCRISGASCRVPRGASGQLSNQVKISFILALIHWLNHKLMKERRKPEYPENSAEGGASGNATYQSPKIPAKPETRTRVPALVTGDC